MINFLIAIIVIVAVILSSIFALVIGVKIGAVGQYRIEKWKSAHPGQRINDEMIDKIMTQVAREALAGKLSTKGIIKND